MFVIFHFRLLSFGFVGTDFLILISTWEFAKSRARHAIRATVIYMPTCQNRANFSVLYDNVPINVPTCQCFKYFNLACQSAKRRCIFSTSLRPKSVPIFQLFFKRIIFFIYLIYSYLICFIYFVYFKYIPNMNIHIFSQLYTPCVKKPI